MKQQSVPRSEPPRSFELGRAGTLPQASKLGPIPSGTDPRQFDREELLKRGAAHVARLLHLTCGRRSGGPVFILMYHRVTAPTAGVPAPSMNVPPAQLRRQLCGLLDRGIQFWRLQRVVELARQGETVPENVAVVTFDDGFQNNLSEALPILEELQIPATLFLSTAYVDSTDPFPMDRWGQLYRKQVPESAYRPLNGREVEQLLESQWFDIGAHTHTHQDFRGRNAAFAVDLARNIEQLEQRFGVTQPLFSFPFGNPDAGFTHPDWMAAAEGLGVTCALTTESVMVAPACSPFGWGRFAVYAWDTPATLAARRAGWFSWMPALKHRLRNLRFGKISANRQPSACSRHSSPN